jgi:hypothetical protein
MQCGDACIDTQTDVNHCGNCDKVCPAVSGGVATCTRGQCGVSCAAGNSACGGKCFDLLTDPLNCGACGKKCAGKKQCLLGLCVP